MPQLPLAAPVILAALVLMPFGRSVELPFGILALLGATMALSGRLRREGVVLRQPLLLYACFALPMLLALPDAVNPEKSLLTTVGSLRYLAFVLGLLFVFCALERDDERRDRGLRWIGAGCAALLVIWCGDGLLQFVTGTDLLGYRMHRGYINSVFGDGENIKFGITLALLLPIALVHALRHWSPLAAAAFLALALLLLTLSGKRSAWIMAIVELSCLAIYYWYRGRLQLRSALAGSALVLAAVVAAYSYSDWVQSRSDVLLTAAEQRDYAAWNDATGYRLPIWSAAVAMARDNWINGVGPRGFRFAYRDYARADDERWTRPLSGGGARASHAHQSLLEIASETGVIGITGWVLLLGVLAQAWRAASEAARSRALPFAVALCGLLFPLNTHAAWYSSWSGSMLWLLIGLYLYALADTAGDRP